MENFSLLLLILEVYLLGQQCNFRTAIEYSESDISEAAIQEKDDSNVVTLFRQKKLIEAAVKIVKPDSESEKDGDDVPLSNLVVKKMFFRNRINFLKSQH